MPTARDVRIFDTVVDLIAETPDDQLDEIEADRDGFIARVDQRLTRTT